MLFGYSVQYRGTVILQLRTKNIFNILKHEYQEETILLFRSSLHESQRSIAFKTDKSSEDKWIFYVDVLTDHQNSRL